MIAQLLADLPQIRWYAQGALNGFETLSPELAAEHAIGTLQSLIRYLDAFDDKNNSVAISIVEGIEPNVVLEGLLRDTQQFVHGTRQ